MPPAPFFLFSQGIAGSGGPTNIILFDDFSGSSLDTNLWTPIVRVADLSNNELNCNTIENISVGGGFLEGDAQFQDHICGDSITAPALYNYTAWMIQQKTAPFLYGRIEIRQMLPGGTGLWPAFWLLGYLWQPSQPDTANTPGSDWPNGGWCELDLFEFMLNERNEVNCQIHFNSFHPGVSAPIPYDATSRFMTYRCDWQADSVVWSVDPEDGSGFQTLFTVTDPAQIPNVPMYVIIDTAVGGTGGGVPNPATFPQTYSVDWVRVTRI